MNQDEALQVDEHLVHEATVELATGHRHGRGRHTLWMHRATCTCGWRSPNKYHPKQAADALREAREHEAQPWAQPERLWP